MTECNRELRMEEEASLCKFWYARLWARLDSRDRKREAALLLFLVLMLVTPRITKYQTQHLYADRRNFFGFPNTINVFSTFPYLIVGCVGVVLCLYDNFFGFSSQGEMWGWACFFFGITASAFGSAFYHLKPCDSRMIWDRLPMTVAFSSVVAVFTIERLDELKGPKSFFPLLIAGLVSLGYWWFAEDVQFFAMVQFIPSIAIPAMTIALPPKYSHSVSWMWAAGLYLVAKIGEVADSGVYRLTRYVVSGHTVKHIGTAMVPVFIIIMLAKQNVKIERLTV